MSISAKVIESYGDNISVGGTAAKGFISAIGITEPVPHPAGMADTCRYRLITNSGDVSRSACVVCGGREFIILRVEPVSIFGAFSHNECIMRLKGGEADV